jgi:hypothetical protein
MEELLKHSTWEELVKVPSEKRKEGRAMLGWWIPCPGSLQEKTLTRRDKGTQ